jgi:hydrogenase nickel incorporation protein HypA/HybF
MHELPITQSLLRITLEQAQAAGAAKVTHLHLVIGQMANIVDDSIQFYWDILAQETIAEGATLYFERPPAMLHCFTCEAEFELNDSDSFLCPRCEGAQVQFIGGDDFRLDSIEVE